jgi:hypothetical protein
LPASRNSTLGALLSLWYTHKKKSIKVFIGIRVEEVYWDWEMIKKSHPNYIALNNTIQESYNRLLNTSLKVRTQGLEPIVERVCEAYNQILISAEEKLNFWETWDGHVEYKIALIRYETHRTWLYTKTVLQDYEKYDNYHFSFDTFDKIRYGKLVEYFLFKRVYKEYLLKCQAFPPFKPYYT